jgi:penicillin-binding protein 2A
LWGFEKGREKREKRKEKREKRKEKREKRKEKREKRKESDLTQRALRKSAEFAEKNEAKSTG